MIRAPDPIHCCSGSVGKQGRRTGRTMGLVAVKGFGTSRVRSGKVTDWIWTPRPKTQRIGSAVDLQKCSMRICAASTISHQQRMPRKRAHLSPEGWRRRSILPVSDPVLATDASHVVGGS